MRSFLADSLRLRGLLPLLSVLALALALRVWGLTWGLPSATHYFSYHPDESVVLGVASGMSVFGGRLLPHWYHYGSLQLYLVCFANTLAALSGSVDIVPKALPGWYPEWAKMYLIGRLLSVGMGVGTVWIVYSLGERLWGRRAGFYAALILAIIPLHVQQSHFLTVDVPGTFWVTLSLLWAVRLATDDPKPWRAALVAGLCAGLAAATKYNLALAILPVLAACVMRPQEPTPARSSPPQVLTPRSVPRREGQEFQKTSTSASLPSPLGRADAKQSGGFLLAALAAFILAFLAACPGAILENQTFLADVRYEAVHVQNPDDPTFHDTGNGFVYHITHNLDAGLGLPLLVLVLVSVGYALYRRERGDGLLAAFALSYYILISLAAVRYARYTIPLLPILVLWVGRLLADGFRLPRPVAQRSAVAIAAVVLFATFVNGVFLMSAMAGTDTRDQALSWLNSYAAAPKRIGFAVQPWFGSPPVSPYFPMPKPGAWQQVTPLEAHKHIFYSGEDWDVAALRTAKPDVVVLSEYDYDDALRLKDQAALAYMAVLQQGYRPIAQFFPLGFDGSMNREGLISRGLPHDMMYPSPDVVIYSQTSEGMQGSD